MNVEKFNEILCEQIFPENSETVKGCRIESTTRFRERHDLPLGFLIAGSSSMIETLWNVDPLCQAVCWNKFYQAVMIDGKDVADAIRSTQVRKTFE